MKSVVLLGLLFTVLFTEAQQAATVRLIINKQSLIIQLPADGTTVSIKKSPAPRPGIY